MKTADIRRAFLDYFAKADHEVVPSSSVVPWNDPSLFFVNAGMVQFKDVFTGQDVRDYTRAVSVQKCMRVSGKHNDLENVGFTARHHTFFEMLGNFSFGDYFKKEALPMAWTFLTDVMGLPEDRLLVTVFQDDEESAAIWRSLGLPDERIGRCGEKDNFWSMGPTGPCGPCSEIFWDLGEEFVPDDEPDPWGFGHDAGRYMEIWNNVFMQFERYREGDDPEGRILQRDLPKPSVDTGMGLERLAAIAQGKTSSWDIDDFQTIIATAAAAAGATYGEDATTDVGLRVIADHARAAAFLIADGVMPSSEERGYVLRRVMRRAIRYGVKLKISVPFMKDVAGTVCDLMGDAYPELVERRAFIDKVVSNEERAFRETLERGLTLIDDAITHLQADGGRTIDGAVVFQLHDTFGFPTDLTQLIASERGFNVDMEGYATHMEEQRARGRAAWKGSGAEGIEDITRAVEAQVDFEFTGWTDTHGVGTVLRIVADGRFVDSANEGETVRIVTDASPFYAEAGGQIGDTGTARTDGVRIRVTDTQKPGGTVHVHEALIERGSLHVGDRLELTVDARRRGDIMRNHTATHLLHAALREVLGEHVQQKGSLVDGDRTRFDFSHFEPLTTEEIAEIEDIVNEQIRADVHTVTVETNRAEAKAMGAMALFGEKYGDTVRVVRLPGFSTELCGGTHCRATGQIGLLKIVSEGGIAAGIRRVEAITGRGAFLYLRELEQTRSTLAERLKTPVDRTVQRLDKFLSDRKALQREVDALKQKLLTGGGPEGPRSEEIGGVQVLAVTLEGASGKELRGHADTLMERLGEGIVLIGSRDGDKAGLLIKVSRSLTDRVRAGDLVREIAPIVGGRGGGRPDMAQAGGRSPEHLGAALEKAKGLIAEALA
jgi:alanyl-tRNA synthetase